MPQFDRFFNERVWIFSHQQPYATVLDGKEDTAVGTLDLGGGPEQAVSDGKGTIYVNISNKANIAVVDVKSMTVKGPLRPEFKRQRRERSGL